jgi:hypothetical protein
MATHIAYVIGWKFNNQEGMETSDGVITAFPGGIPSQADQDTWTAEYLVEFPEGYDAWKDSIEATDSSMPRFLEDLITSNASLVVPAEMKKRYDDKIKVRGERP